jgi:formylmethanofuran dehydrogenase subunit E
MGKGHLPDFSDEITRRMDRYGIDPRLKTEIIQCVAFHTSPAPGVLISAVMVDFALELLGASRGDRVYAVCETPKCAPDALQVIAHCTTGNNRLRIIPIGKFAITMNTPSLGSKAEGVRVYIDLPKLKKFPIIDAWYANSPAFDKPTMKDRLQEEIFRARRDIISWERVRVPVTGKLKWRSVTCPCCGETVPDYLVVDGKCGGCGPLRYYERITD